MKMVSHGGTVTSTIAAGLVTLCSNHLQGGKFICDYMVLALIEPHNWVVGNFLKRER